MTPHERSVLIDRAKNDLKGLAAPELKKDPSLAFKDISLNAFVVLESLDSGAWTTWRDRLKKAGISIRDLKKLMGTARAKLKAAKSSATPPRTVGSMLGRGCPGADLIVPSSYLLTADSTLESDDLEFSSESYIAFTPVLVVRRLTDIVTKTEFLELAWRRDGKWVNRIVDRGVVMDPRKLLGLASVGFPVAGDNATKLSRYLHEFEAANHATLPVSSTSSHLGWQGEDGNAGYLWGKTMIGPDGEDTNDIQFRGIAIGDDQIAAGFHSNGTFDEWRNGLAGIQNHPRALIVFYAAFVAPALRVLGAPNFVLDICGSTSVGKTTLLRIAASVWGCPDETRSDAAIHTWDATQVWAERCSAVQSDLPLILDETKRAQDGQFIQDIIYMVVSGRGRGRGNIESMERTTAWKTVLISSGEAPAVSYSKAGGTRTRCLEVRGLPLGAQDDATGILARQLNALVCANYGHAGPKFVRYLLKHHDRWEEYGRTYASEIGRYRALAPGCREADRLAQAFAAISAVVQIVHEALDLPWKYEVGVSQRDMLWPDISSEAQGAAGAEEALKAVMDWAYSKESTFHGRNPYMTISAGGWSGVWSNEPTWSYLAIYKQTLEKVLKDARFEPEAILYEWKSRKWIDCRKDRKNSYVKQVGIPGSDDSPYMVFIWRKAIDSLEDES